MADLRGKGGFSGVNLIVKIPTNREIVNEATGEVVKRYLEIQKDQSLLKPEKILSGETQADTNPYLTTSKVTTDKGDEIVVHGRVAYTVGQIEAMKKAAGKNMVTLENGDVVLGIKADLAKNKAGFVMVNTKNPMEKSKNNHFGKNILEKQKAVVLAAREFRDKSKEQVAEASTEMEAQKVDEPAFDLS